MLGGGVQRLGGCDGAGARARARRADRRHSLNGGWMARATWNGAVIAESDDIEVVEGNLYFPAGAVRREHLAESDTHTVCPWKGTASYYHVVVDGEQNRDAA